MSATSAIYNKDDKKQRAVNRFGVWQKQNFSGSEKGTRTFDPWYDVGQPSDERPQGYK